MGERGPAAAARFRDDVHAAEMLAVYERGARRAEPLGGPRRGRAPPATEAEAPWPS